MYFYSIINVNTGNQERTYTIDDIYALPEGERAELIDGQIYYMASSSSRRMDYAIKLFKYRSAGVREYWIVDPDKNRIMIHNFEMNDIREYSFTDHVYSSIYDDLSIDFSQLDI